MSAPAPAEVPGWGPVVGSCSFKSGLARPLSSEEFGGRGSVHVVPVDFLPLGVLASTWRTGFLGRQSFVFLKQGDLVSNV